MERIYIHGHEYELLTNHREGWDPEAFKRRFSEILDKYDYIVGDWGYGQLRLKGLPITGHVPRLIPKSVIWRNISMNFAILAVPILC